MKDVCIKSTEEFMEYIKDFDRDISGHSITDVNFSNVDFSSIKGYSLYFMRCTFYNCTNVSIVADGLYECDFKSCIFNKNESRFTAHVCYCEFNSCKIYDTFISARIYECEFNSCHINDVCVNGSSSINASVFRECDIIEVSFYYGSNGSLIAINDGKIINCDFSGTVECYGVHISNDTIVENVKAPFIRNLCPDGEFVGYKSVRSEGHSDPCIATLLIPSDAKRLSSINGKCRCDKAKVLAIESLSGTPLATNIHAASRYHKNQISYKVGEWVYADSFNEDPFIECSNGTHFFMTKEEAMDY